MHGAPTLDYSGLTPVLLRADGEGGLRPSGEKTDEGRDLYWVQVLRAGKVEDRDLELTHDHLREMVERFESHLAEHPGHWVQANYGHAPAYAADAEAGKAAGWVHRLETRADGQELWALVDFTDEALERIRRREYRYTSAEIAFDEFSVDRKGRVTLRGARFRGFALTNDPAIRGMAPLFAASTPKRPPTHGGDMDALLAALGLPEGSTIDQAVAAVQALRSQVPGSDVVVLARADHQALLAERDRLREELEAKRAELAKRDAADAVARWQAERRITPAQAETLAEQVQRLGVEVVEGLLPPPGTLAHLYEDPAGGESRAPEGERALTYEEADAQIAALLAEGKSDEEIRRDHPELVAVFQRGVMEA